MVMPRLYTGPADGPRQAALQEAHLLLRTGVPTWHLVMDEMGGRLAERGGRGSLTTTKGRSSIWLMLLKSCIRMTSNLSLATSAAKSGLCIPTASSLCGPC